MRAYLFACCVLISGALPACVFGSDHGGGSLTGDPACVGTQRYTIDTGASIDHTAGVDPGYYAEYDGSGAWHFEWTCDTKLSAYGCEFSGAITAPTPAGGIGATCFDCEADDDMTTTPVGGSTEIDFDTITSTGIDGVDFTTTPGASVTIDLQVNGIYQDDLVFIPSNGAAVTPSCLPVDLAPSTP